VYTRPETIRTDYRGAGLEKNIAVIGGTGAEGSALALRFAKAGFRIFLGSRDQSRAETAAREIAARCGSDQVRGCTNQAAAASASIVILTVPLSAQIETLKGIREHLNAAAILVDTTVPLEVAIGGRLSRLVTLWDGSAAQQAARLVPGTVSVVAAFHGLSADLLARLDQSVDCDTLICGNSDEAKRTVCELGEAIPGVHAIDAGPLENARFLENAAALLIAINLKYKVKHSGIRITGLLKRSGPHE
jgi:NADPH-dependent F420 reductase